MVIPVRLHAPRVRRCWLEVVRLVTQIMCQLTVATNTSDGLIPQAALGIAPLPGMAVGTVALPRQRMPHVYKYALEN